MNTRVGVLTVGVLLGVVPGVAAAQAPPESPELFGFTIVTVAVIQTAIAGFVALAMVAMFPDWMEKAVRTARKSTVVSFGVGIAGAILSVILAFFLGLAMLVPLVGFVIAIVALFVAVPITIAGLAVSVVTLGSFLSSQLGLGNVVAGVALGALAVGVLPFIPVVGPIVHTLVQILGLGATLRVLAGGGKRKSIDRTPPTTTRV